MIKTINGKTYNIPDSEIQHNMKALDITQEEAVEMWLDDHDITVNEELEELDSKAKTVKISHRAAADKEPKERKPREKKQNPTKQTIISTINQALAGLADIENLTIRNNEKYIDFTLGGTEYTLNLVAHRKAKK